MYQGKNQLFGFPGLFGCLKDLSVIVQSVDQARFARITFAEEDNFTNVAISVIKFVILVFYAFDELINWFVIKFLDYFQVVFRFIRVDKVEISFLNVFLLHLKVMLDLELLHKKCFLVHFKRCFVTL